MSYNYAGLQGGGINYQGQVGLVQNCTLSGNTVPSDEAQSGTAILNLAIGGQAAPALTVTACTIAQNTGDGAFVVAAVNDAGLTNSLLSTLVANNIGVNFYVLSFTSPQPSSPWATTSTAMAAAVWPVAASMATKLAPISPVPSTRSSVRFRTTVARP